MKGKAMIDPTLGAGFRDYLPKDMIPRQKMFDTIRMVFESFGFLPLDTPTIEREEILTGGDPEFKKQIFRVANSGTGESALAIRFDLTVPLARVVAAYPNDIPRPFKRYQVGKVCRGEKPQAGRFREFVQFDADIAGSKLPMADAEIIALMNATMSALGFAKFVIRVNTRKILNGLAAFAGYPDDRNEAVLRAIDKLDKIAWEGVRDELTREPGDRNNPGVGLTGEQADAIKRFLDIRGGSNNEVLDNVERLMGNSPQAMEGVGDLSEIAACLEALGVPDNRWVVDLSVARGLGYYTGAVFETILTDLPSIGSVFSGGRYDDLVSRFSSMNIPATGASVGVDRLFAAMEKLDIVPKEATVTKAMVLNFESDCRFLIQAAAARLRAAGIPTEVYLGQEMTLKGQLANTVKQDIPVVIIIGGDEKAKGTATIKKLATREQRSVNFEDIVPVVTELLR